MAVGEVLSIAEFFGFVLASYGVLRECFATLATARPYGEGRYGEGTYGGGASPPLRLLIELGTRVRLLPGDQTLTLTDRKRNAGLAVAGVMLSGVALFLSLWF